MSSGYFDSLALIRRTFRSFPANERFHILGRFLSCPFLRVLPYLPPRARLLDIGAGHGTFPLLAIENGAASAIAVEPDLRKSLPSIDAERVRFVAAYDDAVTGTFDAVTMFDVLYRIPRAEWPALFERVASRLAPGGVFLLKELNPEKRAKFLWNRLQETISDRFLKITLGDAFVYARPAEVEEQFDAAGFVDFRAVAIDRGYPHSHVLYIGRRTFV